MDRLFNEGRVEDIARSLENANKEENWPFLKELVNRVISADLSEKVDSELKTNDRNLSLQKLTENLIYEFLSRVPEIKESNPQEGEDIRELAAAAECLLSHIYMAEQLYQALISTNIQLKECERLLHEHQGSSTARHADDYCYSEIKKTALELVVEASPDEGDEELRDRVIRLFIEEGVDIARSLANAGKRRVWPVVYKLVETVFSLDLNTAVDNALKDKYQISLPQLACLASVSVLEITEPLVILFLSQSLEINGSNEEETARGDSQQLLYKDICDLAAAASRNEHFREIWSEIQFAKRDVEADQGDQSNIRDKLKEKLEAFAKDKRLSDPYFMSLEWLRDCMESAKNPDEEEEKSPTGAKKRSRSSRNASWRSRDPELRALLFAQSMTMEGRYGAVESDLLEMMEEGRWQGLQMKKSRNEDILVKALKLSESFESMSLREHEYREQYKTQSKVVQQFASDIVEEARGDDELREIMDLEGEGTLEARVSKQSQQERLPADPQWEHKTQHIKSLGLLQMATEKKLKVVGSQWFEILLRSFCKATSFV